MFIRFNVICSDNREMPYLYVLITGNTLLIHGDNWEIPSLYMVIIAIRFPFILHDFGDKIIYH